MPIYKGDNNIKPLYLWGGEIKEAYVGDVMVYKKESIEYIDCRGGMLFYIGGYPDTLYFTSTSDYYIFAYYNMANFYNRKIHVKSYVSGEDSFNKLCFGFLKQYSSGSGMSSSNIHSSTRINCTSVADIDQDFTVPSGYPYMLVLGDINNPPIITILN